MLRKRLIDRLSIFVLLLLFSLGFSQTDSLRSNFEVLYRVDFSKDTLRTDKILSEMMVLQIGDGVSLYKSNQKAISDSLRRALMEKQMKGVSSGGNVTLDFSNVPKVNIYHEVYKNHDDVQMFDKLSRNYYHFKPYHKVVWELGNKQKEISGYHCRHAIGFYNGRKYEAWYTDEIPFPEGPYVFKNLPGLIVELYDTKGYFHFTLVSFQKKSDIMKVLDESIKTDYFAFIKMRKQDLENPTLKYKGLLGKSLSPQMRKRMMEKAKRNNNFLD